MLFDYEYFFKNVRMTPATFEKLISWEAPSIAKSTIRSEVACPTQRLCIKLRHLATGDAQLTIATSYSMGPALAAIYVRHVIHMGYFS